MCSMCDNLNSLFDGHRWTNKGRCMMGGGALDLMHGKNITEYVDNGNNSTKSKGC